jgi:hypothetical protein
MLRRQAEKAEALLIDVGASPGACIRRAKTAFDIFGSEFPDEVLQLLLMSRANPIGARSIRKIPARRKHLRNQQA